MRPWRGFFWMQCHLKTNHLPWLTCYAHQLPSTFVPHLNLLVYNAVFFSYHLFWHTLITYGPTYLNSASSIKCLCTLLREKLFLWGICYSLLGHYGFEDGSCLSTTWASATCLKTAARWIKTPEGSQWGSLFRGKIGPNRITSKCIFRMKILTSALPRACAHNRSALPTDTLSPGLLMAQGTRAPPG